MGPLRIWPGGLCLSRAIGDFDVGDAVIPFPHIMQASRLRACLARLLVDEGREAGSSRGSMPRLPPFQPGRR